MDARRTITYSMIGSALLIGSDDIANGHFPAPSKFISLIFLTIILTVMAGFIPEVAGPLALLVFVAVLLTKGSNVFKKLKF